MRIILTSTTEALTRAWTQFCADLDFVQIQPGSILDVRCDAVVSPANSFGFMDGGLDLLYSNHFGWHVQEELQRLIVEHHHGELLVGTAEIVETRDERTPFLISAPTMRVPMILTDTVNPFLAARAALLLVKQGAIRSGQHQGRPVSELVRSVAFPGLGTGVGRVEPQVCARQVRAAIDEVILDRYPFPESWAEVSERHQRLYTSQVRDLQYE
jgi:O-acetyl-ADP-ribose deacetylase (regulator of RNase III)